MTNRHSRGQRMNVVPLRGVRVATEKDTNRAAKQQLERVLSSTTFRQVDRLKRFLSFIVAESVAGRGDQLKEYVIGVQVFDKDTSFDPRADPIVRVQARRLRARLVRYYREEGGSDGVVIELPKGGYAPVFRSRDGSAAGRRSMGPTLAGQNTIAVLPFSDHSANRDLGYFCDGLCHELIHRLARIEALRVVVLPPVESGNAGTGLQYGSQVAMLLSGAVRNAGDRHRRLSARAF